MELTITEIKKITLNKLYSYEGVTEAVERVEEQILDNAKRGLTDLLIYKSEFDEIIFHLVIRVLKLKGYDITTYQGDPLLGAELVNVNWS